MVADISIRECTTNATLWHKSKLANWKKYKNIILFVNQYNNSLNSNLSQLQSQVYSHSHSSNI